MNNLSFTHSNNHPIPSNCKLDELSISDDFTKIYKNKICIITLCNVPQNSDDCKLYSCKLYFDNDKINVKFIINNFVLENLIYNGEKIPSRKNFFKLIKRNHIKKSIYNHIPEIFTQNTNIDNIFTNYSKNRYKYKLDSYQKNNLIWMENI